MLYPLFVHNIGALLYHPINRGFTSAIPRSQEIAQFPGVMQSQVHSHGGDGYTATDGGMNGNGNGGGITRSFGQRILSSVGEQDGGRDRYS